MRLAALPGIRAGLVSRETRRVAQGVTYAGLTDTTVSSTTQLDALSVIVAPAGAHRGHITARSARN
jgi:hypothetical protein